MKSDRATRRSNIRIANSSTTSPQSAPAWRVQIAAVQQFPPFALMRHLTNPEERPKTPAIERRHAPEWTAVGAHTRQLIGASIAGHTRTAYASALARFDRALVPFRPTDAGIADYLGSLYRDGRSPATIALVVDGRRAIDRLQGIS